MADVYRHESEEEENFEVIEVNVVHQEERRIESITQAKLEGTYEGDKFDEK
jgi:hypothetical protein